MLKNKPRVAVIPSIPIVVAIMVTHLEFLFAIALWFFATGFTYSLFGRARTADGENLGFIDILWALLWPATWCRVLTIALVMDEEGRTD